MKAIIYDENGRLSFCEASLKEVGKNDIRVLVKAAGVNRADLLQKMGHYPPPKGVSEILGLEVSGVVKEIGENVKRFQVGDQVMGLLAGGGYATEVIDDEHLFLRIPAGMDVYQAGAVPEVFLTAYQSLFDLSHLKQGETVLIHAGASGVGTAAIQLAKSVGANVIVTVSNEEKAKFCEGLGADLAINYKSVDFVEVVKEFTKGRGVDVLVDVVGGTYVTRNIDCMATEGGYVLLAFMGGAKSEINLAKVLTKRIHLMGSTLRSRSMDYKSRLISSFEKRFLPDFETGSLKPVIDQMYDWSEAEKAHEYMSLNLTKGKLVLRVN